MEEKKYIELEKLGNKKPFTVPENYFNDFEAKMDELTKADNPQKSFRIRPWMYGVAASIVGIILMGQVYFTVSKNNDLTSEAYETYVLSQVNETSIIDYYYLTSETETE